MGAGGDTIHYVHNLDLYLARSIVGDAEEQKRF